MPDKESDFDNLPPTIPPGQPPQDDSWVGKVPLVFGNYTRIRELGKGGFGIVYHVRHRSLGFDRALKVLDPRIAAEIGEKQRFLREARVLAGLHHVPQVVHIHEVSTEADPWNWLLMELIPGLPLAENYHAVSAAHCLEWHRQSSETGEGRLQEASVLRIFRDVLTALQAAHEKGIIHRDLKPGNILLMPDGGAKLADFGLVKLVDGKAGAEEKGQISTKNLPNSNRYMGTTAYMSPEQQDGHPLDARSDTYSLGLVIYELLVGHRPSLRMKLPHQMGLPVAPWWDDVLDRMLETRPADRPASAAAVAAMLPGSVDEASTAERAAAKEAARQAALAQQAKEQRAANERILTTQAARADPETAKVAAEQEQARQAEVPRKRETSSSPAGKSKPLPWIIAACAAIGLIAWGASRLGSQSKGISPSGPEENAAQQEELQRERESAQAAAAQAKAAEEQAESIVVEAAQTKAKEDAVKQEAERQRLADLAAAETAIASKITKDQPFVNSLGMKFVPVKITSGPSAGQQVLFSVWETRLQDFEKLVNNSKSYRYETGTTPMVWDGKEWKKIEGASWKSPGFTQTMADPVTCVSFLDAVAFCEWLTQEERSAGKIPATAKYRLPTDHEWSCAVGIGDREDATATPASKDGKITNVFPWGMQWPPPEGSGNYAVNLEVDNYQRTSPVGRFPANDYGIYDLGGNLWEWVDAIYEADNSRRVMRGASWLVNGRGGLSSSYRNGGSLDYRGSSDGFRCVLVMGPTSLPPPSIR